MANTSNQLEVVQVVVAKFGMMAARNGEIIEIRKGAKLAATVISAAPGSKSDYASRYFIDRKYDGKQALLGAFGAQKIAEALKGCR